MRVLVMTDLAWRRLMRSRFLWVAVGVSVMGMFTLISGISLMLGMQKDGDAAGAAWVMQGLLAASITMQGVLVQLVAFVLGINVVRRDLVEGTVASVLSKPVSRGEYMAGCVLASGLFLLLMWAVFTLLLQALVVSLGGGLGWEHITAILSRVLVSWMAFAIALLVSMRLPAWPALFVAVLITNGTGVLQALVAVFKAVGFTLPAGTSFIPAIPFPITDELDQLTEQLVSGVVDAEPVWLGVLHIADYTVVMIVLAWLWFRHVELSKARE